MVVIPAEVQKTGSVAQEFFNKTFGVLGGNSVTNGVRAFNAVLAISSLGNIIVMTFTAARMKQEIAKQGFLPFPKFFAQNRDLSFGRLLGVLESRFGLRIPGLDPAQHSEKTPVGAFVLHFLSCIVLIFATYNLSPSDAYSLLSGLIAYLPTAWFGCFLAMGILILRFRGPPRTEPANTRHRLGDSEQQTGKTSWTEMTGGAVLPWLSVTSATVYLIGNLYPVITDWVPPSTEFYQTRWYLVPVISWCVLAFSTLWFCGFLARAKLRKNERFLLEREPAFEMADGGKDSERGGGGRGGLILIHETVTFSWPGTEMSELERMREADDVVGGGGLPP